MSDTIAAIATAAGRGAVGVLRISGPQAAAVARAICGSLPAPRQAALRGLRSADGELIDHGLVLHFPAPGSYTGEDVVELQTHGAPVVLRALLRAAIAAGARQARPGEFTERAFLNGRMDLAQAEAVAALIDAASEQAGRAALRSLQGALSERITALRDRLTALRAHLEALLDFPEEDIDRIAQDELARGAEELLHALDRLLRDMDGGRRLADGLTVVIAGRPNAGKSTLLNLLCARSVAIVSDIPGTTRDLLTERVLLRDVPVTLTDTAGLRRSDDPIEAEGVRRARKAAAAADLIVYLFDAAGGWHDEDEGAWRTLPVGVRRLRVASRADLLGDRPPPPADLVLSARTGDGVDTLIDAMLADLPDTAAPLAAREWHLTAARAARDAIARAQQLAAGPADPALVAEELAEAHRQLGTIVGAVDADALLGEIFSRFCIGK